MHFLNSLLDIPSALSQYILILFKQSDVFQLELIKIYCIQVNYELNSYLCAVPIIIDIVLFIDLLYLMEFMVLHTIGWRKCEFSLKVHI